MDRASFLEPILSAPWLGPLVGFVLTFVLFAFVLRLKKWRPKTSAFRRTLKAIRRAPIKPRVVLNQPERKVYRDLSNLVAQSCSHTLLTQVSMGEFLRIDGKRVSKSIWLTAFNAFNAKRVDFLIVDADWVPCVVIEYQGTGHGLGNAASRDAIKRAVCARASIPMVEVASGGLTARQTRDLRETLRVHRTGVAA